MYDRGADLLATERLDWENDDIRVALVTDAYTFDQERDETLADIAAYEVAPSGTYERGGSPVTGRYVVRGELPHDRAGFADPEIRWEGFTGAFNYLVCYRATQGDLIAVCDVGPQQMTRGTVAIDVPGAYWSLEQTTLESERDAETERQLLAVEGGSSDG